MDTGVAWGAAAAALRAQRRERRAPALAPAPEEGLQALQATCGQGGRGEGEVRPRCLPAWGVGGVGVQVLPANCMHGVQVLRTGHKDITCDPLCKQ